MRVLIVSQYYTPDITAAAFRISETAELLSAWGHQVQVVTSEPHRAQAHTHAEAPSQPNETPGQSTEASGTTAEAPGPAADEAAAAKAVEPTQPNETPGQSAAAPTVHRVALDPLEGSGLKPYLKHYLSFVRRARKAGKAVIREGFVPDIIWVSSPPLFVGLVGPGLRRRAKRAGQKGVRFILDIRDIWPDTAVAAGQLTEGGRAYKLGRRLEKHLYRRADALSCVARPMAAYLRRESGKRVQVVYNGVSAGLGPGGGGTPGGDTSTRETSADGSAPAGSALAAAGSSGGGPYEPRRDRGQDTPRPEMLYAGNWGRLQGLDVLLTAWAEVCETEFYREWTVRLIGDGVMADELREQCNKLDLQERVSFEPPVAKQEALRAMAEAGLLFLNLRPDAVFNYTIPSKLFDYLLAGRPIIGGILGEGAEILEENEGNLTFGPGNSRDLVEALRHAAERYNQLRAGARQNRQLVAARFTRERATEQLLELFQAPSLSA
jgi:glycosyltransferase involved in cell wall biosynthesis